MLENTFIHIQGIGPRGEKELWKRGIIRWKDFLESPGTIFSRAKDEFVRSKLEESIVHRSDAGYFAKRLPASELWRLFGETGFKTVYLDIETSGSYHGAGDITVIGLYDGHTVRSFVNGKNLEEFEEEICGYDLLVTFNGTCFDVPVIRRWFRHTTFPPAHIDLRFLLKRLGLRGGLKAIERQHGIRRSLTVEGLDGYDAVMLWEAYQWGDEASLERLINYNSADILSLKILLEFAYGRLRRELLGSKPLF